MLNDALLIRERINGPDAFENIFNAKYSYAMLLRSTEAANANPIGMNRRQTSTLHTYVRVYIHTFLYVCTFCF